MATFAIHDGQKVVNVIVADSQSVAEEVTGLSAIESSGTPWFGWTMESEGWRKPSPYPSWVWDGSDWAAPVERPSDTEDGWYEWNEDSVSWIFNKVNLPEN